MTTTTTTMRYTVIPMTNDPTDHRRRVYDALTEAPIGAVISCTEIAVTLAAQENERWRERLLDDARLIVLPVAGRRRLWLVPPVAATDGSDGGGEVA